VGVNRQVGNDDLIVFTDHGRITGNPEVTGLGKSGRPSGNWPGYFFISVSR
jgi:hypothetical protein